MNVNVVHLRKANGMTRNSRNMFLHKGHKVWNEVSQM